MLLVGLTGGLASGKSTVARLLEERGAIVVDADELAREAVAPRSPGLQRVIELFGERVLAKDGSLDRAALAEIVFADEEARRSLEAIVHPEVFRLLAERLAPHRATEHVAVFDAPLIVETGFDEVADVVIVVTSPVEEQKRRVAQQRGMAEEEAERRIAAQVSAVEREARADIVLHNDGSLDELAPKVHELWDELVAGARGTGG